MRDYSFFMAFNFCGGTFHSNINVDIKYTLKLKKSLSQNFDKDTKDLYMHEKNVAFV